MLAKLARVIVLVTFWGCLGLSTLLQDQASTLQVISWRDFYFDGRRLFVSIFRDKPVKTWNECHRIVLKLLTLFTQPSAAFLGQISGLIAPNSAVKGHFTGHSFRRGHAEAAISVGIEIDDMMLFGNWRSVPSELHCMNSQNVHCFSRDDLLPPCMEFLNAAHSRSSASFMVVGRAFACTAYCELPY